MQRQSRPKGLVKTYPKGVKALDGLSLRRPAGHDLRPARAQRRGQVDRRQDPHDAGRGRRGPRHRRRDRRGRRPRPGSPGASASVLAGLGRRHPGHRAARTCVCRARSTACAAAALEQRVHELLERFGLTDAANRIARGYSGGMQRRLDIAMAPGARPRRCCSSTSRPPASTPRCGPTCGTEIARARRRARQDRAAHHPLPRGGRPVGRAGGDRRPRQGRGRRHPGGAQARATRRRHPRRPRGRLQRHGRPRARRARGGPRRHRRGPGAAGPRGRRRPRRAAVLQALEAHGVGVASVRVARPSLDDVYLQYTGRTFDAAEAEARLR